MFGAGKVAMMIGPNNIPTYLSDGGYDINYDVTTIPANEGCESVAMGVCDRLEVFKDDSAEDQDARTAAITKFFDDYVYEVHKHMSYEEKIVFPYVRNLQDGVKDSKYNISIFRKRHDQIEMKIVELKNILLKYYPGPDNYLLNSILFDIFATEQDLASHNRVEDYLFVPAVLAIEKTIK